MGEKKERVTRADVAELAGVSETIVSYVMNNNRYVAKDKRERVEEAVRLLNYRPNNVARALKGKPSNQILFIADHITNEYFASIVNEMDQYAYDAGYLISLRGNCRPRNLYRRSSAVSTMGSLSVREVSRQTMWNSLPKPEFRWQSSADGRDRSILEE